MLCTHKHTHTLSLSGTLTLAGLYQNVSIRTEITFIIYFEHEKRIQVFPLMNREAEEKERIQNKNPNSSMIFSLASAQMGSPEDTYVCWLWFGFFSFAIVRGYFISL